MPDGETLNNKRMSDEEMFSAFETAYRDEGEKVLNAANAAMEEEKAAAMEEEKAAAAADEVVAGSNEADAEYETTPEAETNQNKGKHKKNFKKTLTAIALGVILAGTVAGFFAFKDTDREEPDLAKKPDSREAAFSMKAEKPEIKSLTGFEMLDLLIDGSFSQYDILGCYDYEPEKKVSKGAVGNPDAVLEALGIDPNNATAEERGAVQEYFAYAMAEPAAPVAIAGSFEGFSGLTQNEAENKIKNMSLEEKANLQDQLKDYFDKTEYYYKTGSGPYRNHFIYEDANGEKHSSFVESDLTGKRVLIGETILPNGATVIWMSKEDCGNNEDRFTVVSPDAPPIEIVIPEDPQSPEEPESNPTEEPTKEEDETPVNPVIPNYWINYPTNPAPKNEQALIDNAGERVDEQNLDTKITPETIIAQDQENFADIEQQRKEDELRAIEAERIRAEQAEKERIAAEQAARIAEEQARANEQQIPNNAEAQAAAEAAANEAAARAAAAAAAEQQAAAAAEAQAAAEAAAAANAQAAADAAAAANAAAAAANANAGAQERANIFANGEF